MPRLKYHNPAIPMTVNRTTNQDGPAVMTIHFTEPTGVDKILPAVPSTTSTQSSSILVSDTASPERIETINMKHRHESEILSQLLSITKAVPIEPTEKELEQIRDLEEQRLLSEQDSRRSQIVNENRRRKEAILAQARGEIAAAQEA